MFLRRGLSLHARERRVLGAEGIDNVRRDESSRTWEPGEPGVPVNNQRRTGARRARKIHNKVCCGGIARTTADPFNKVFLFHFFISL